jgi:hypothetical protein
VNQWIRENNEADGFVDFEEALKDSSDQNALAAPFASADKLHPSTEGAQEMALTAFNKLFAE